MKAFKKLMAAALVCVMALAMFTGCAVSDKLDEKAMVKALNKKHDIYVSENDLDSKAENAWNNNTKDGVVTEGKDKGTIKVGDKTYNYIIVEVPDSASKSGNWSDTATKIDAQLKDSKTNTKSKVELGVKFKSGKKGSKDVDYVVVVAEAK